MTRSIKALVFTAPQTVEVREFALPECGDDEVVVQTHYSMVSSGTDLRVLAGKQGTGDSKAYYPLIPGYSSVGAVVEVGANAKGWRVGDLVSGRNPSKNVAGIRSLWGGHASFNIYPASGYCQPARLPSGAKPLDYAAVELAAISGRGVRAAAVRPGETAIVLGQGMIGAMSAAWLVAAGARVGVTDMAENRLKRAAGWGVAATFAAQDPNILARINSFTGGGADIVVESSASMAGVKLAGALIRSQRATGTSGHFAWPRLVFQASYTDEYSTDPGKLFVGEGAVVLTPGDRDIEDRNAAVEAFRKGVLKASAFIDHVLPTSEAQEAYDGLRTRPNDYFSVIFDWRA